MLLSITYLLNLSFLLNLAFLISRYCSIISYMLKYKKQQKLKRGSYELYNPDNEKAGISIA